MTIFFSGGATVFIFRYIYICLVGYLFREKMKLTKEDKKLIEEAKQIIVKSEPVNLIDTGEVGWLNREVGGKALLINLHDD